MHPVFHCLNFNTIPPLFQLLHKECLLYPLTVVSLKGENISAGNGQLQKTKGS
jgi:hypothetical protein